MAKKKSKRRTTSSTKSRAAARSGSVPGSRSTKPRQSSKPKARSTERAVDPALLRPFPAEATVGVQPLSGSSQPSGETTAPRGSLPWQASAARLDPERLAHLRHFVVNLNQGAFSAGGKFTSTPQEVDAIFEEHLPRWAAARGSAGEPHRIVLFAHGGLVDEQRGLEIAAKQVDWWFANGVYPIFFVWETGLFETLGQLLSAGQREVGARDLFDFTSDPLLEIAARALGGPKIWGGMKRSAELAFATGGGGIHALRGLGAAMNKLGKGRVQLHAIGHSAGSIFHSHLLPAAATLGLPRFESLLLLAPAITAADFRTRVLPLAGKAFARTAMFTMSRDLERADNCSVYRKSLLYLIYHALEPNARTEILGLEESVRRDAVLRAFFGLGGAGKALGEIIWSATAQDVGTNASRSTSHGGFDDDPPTMNSVLRRVLDRPEGAIEEFPREDGAARALRPVGEAIADELERQGFDADAYRRTMGATTSVSVASTWEAASATDRATAPEGRHRALCIGIDDYPDAPLSGCVADATLWHDTFKALGFEMEPLLTNGEATREAILEQMKRLIDDAAPGDVVAIQYAGHGTRVEDIDGDEADGDTPGFDEAMVPFDYGFGAYVIDDDLAELFRRAKAGVNVTCFFDCCHSGTMNRLWASSLGTTTPADPTERSRYLPVSDARNAAHRAFRERLGTGRGIRAAARANGMGGVHAAAEVFFSACRSDESALESNGHGHFTLRAAKVLRQGIDDLTNEGFHDRVLAAFGTARRQTPELHCADDRRTLLLMKAASDMSRDKATGGVKAADRVPLRDRREIATALQQLARRLR